jgi:glycosyltransferase involved in cell wall biosynthesis
MKAILVCDGLFPLQIGGMQKHSTLLARYLLRAGVDLTLVHPHRDDEVQALFAEEASQPRLIAVPWPSSLPVPGHYLLSNYRYSVRVRTALLRFGHAPAPVYVQGFSGWKLISDPLPGFPVLLNFHGLEMFQRLQGARNRLQAGMLRQPARMLMRKAQGVVSLGGKLADIIRREAPAARVFTLPVGIEESWCETPFRNSGTKRNFLFVGRYEWRKGIELLQEVLPRALEVSPEAHFRFVGDIPVQLQIRDRRVQYEGAVRDEQRIREYYNAADVLLCPSWSEGMPTVIHEGMASGLAVIATDVGGVAEQVDESNGFLLRPGDATALEAAILACCGADAGNLDKFRLRSREKVRQFFWPRVARLTLEALESLQS